MLIMNEINKEAFNVHKYNSFFHQKREPRSLVIVILFFIIHLQVHSVSDRHS